MATHWVLEGWWSDAEWGEGPSGQLWDFERRPKPTPPEPPEENGEDGDEGTS